MQEVIDFYEQQMNQREDTIEYLKGKLRKRREKNTKFGRVPGNFRFQDFN